MNRSYLDEIAIEIRRTAEPEAVESEEDLLLYRVYAVLLLAKGEKVSAEDVHNAWAVWACENEPHSKSLIPFQELSLSAQSKDGAYVEAIHKVAKNTCSYN